jgi:hypothetical protein
MVDDSPMPKTSWQFTQQKIKSAMDKDEVAV